MKHKEAIVMMAIVAVIVFVVGCIIIGLQSFYGNGGW